VSLAEREDEMRVVLLSKTPDLALIRVLRDAGHDLWHTRPGENAYRHTRDAFPAAVLIDLADEAEQGFAAAAQLASHPRTQGIPVVLYNAADVSQARSRAPFVRALLSAPSRQRDILRALSAFETEETG
jgi:CheY-like chemotaxis protein